jgi:hypothetical protein
VRRVSAQRVVLVVGPRALVTTLSARRRVEPGEETLLLFSPKARSERTRAVSELLE